jgi:hypothetical protein
MACHGIRSINVLSSWAAHERSEGEVEGAAFAMFKDCWIG